MERYIIRDGSVILPDGISKHTDVLLADGRIALLPRGAEVDAIETDARGAYVSPGFVDIHQHGGGGCDYMDGSEDAFRKALSTHVLHGTTSVMPTTLSAETVSTEKALSAYLALQRSGDPPCNLLGINMEGPYLSPQQTGAQSADRIRSFKPEEYEKLYEASEGCIKRWSVAPELDGAEDFARFAERNGITLSIAHSNATFEQTLRAYELGFRHVTHFYSCVSTVRREKGFRIAGVVEAAYYLDGMNVELIADGCHLPSSLIKLVTKLKRNENIALVSDAMRAAGQDVTESYLGSGDSKQPVVIENGVAMLPSREAFGGSIATSDRLLRTALSAGCELSAAVKMLTSNPLHMMGVGKNTGEIREGFDADICVFDKDISIKAVFVRGKRTV